MHIAHPEAGIIVLIENEERRVDHNITDKAKGMSAIKGVKMIAQSPGGGFFAYLTEDNNLWVGF